MPEREQREQGGSEDRRTQEAGVAHHPNTRGGGVGGTGATEKGHLSKLLLTQQTGKD